MKMPTLIIFCAALAAAFSSPADGQTDRLATTPIHAVVWDATQGIRDLGTLGGASSYGLGINDRGIVVGYSYLADNVTFHAFLWSASRGMVDIGATFSDAQNTWGVGINASETAAVTGFLSDGSALPAAFHLPGFWRHLPLGTDLSQSLNRSYGINDANQVTGQYLINNAKTGFLWDPATSTITYLRGIGGYNTIGVAVNNLAHVTGAGSVYDGADSIYDALFWSADQGSRDIGSLNGSDFTAGGGINNNDEVVGYNLPELAGFYWSDATGMVPLQSLGGNASAAFGINSSGRIAGYGGLPDGTVHAVVWAHYSSAPQDLGTLTGSGNSYGRGINSYGRVVGYSEMP